MRLLTKPSTAQCDLNLYILFLLAEPKYISCIRLARLLEDLSHDSVNRFLLRERYGARDLFNMVSPQSVFEKSLRYSQEAFLRPPDYEINQSILRH